MNFKNLEQANEFPPERDTSWNLYSTLSFLIRAFVLTLGVAGVAAFYYLLTNGY